MKKFFDNIGKSEIRNIIAVLYIVMIIGFIYVLAFKPVPPENKDLVNVLGGVVIGGVGVILSFLYGTSKDQSNDKHHP